MSRKKTRTCPHCSERFARPENLTEHVQVAHTESVKKLSCPLCTELISKVTNLRKHVGRRHSQSPNFLTNIGGIARWKGKKVKVEFVKHSQLYKGRFIREIRQIDSETDDWMPPPSRKKKRAILSDGSDDDSASPVIPCDQDTTCDMDDFISPASTRSTINSIGAKHDNMMDSDDQNLSEVMPVFVAVKEEYAETENDGSDTLTMELDSSGDANIDRKTMMIKFEPLKGLIKKALVSEHTMKLSRTLVFNILEWIGK